LRHGLAAPPLAFLVLVFAGWVDRQQQAVIDYLLEELNAFAERFCRVSEVRVPG